METFDQKGQVREGTFPENEISGHETPSDGVTGKESQAGPEKSKEAQQEATPETRQESAPENQQEATPETQQEAAPETQQGASAEGNKEAPAAAGHEETESRQEEEVSEREGSALNPEGGPAVQKTSPLQVREEPPDQKTEKVTDPEAEQKQGGAAAAEAETESKVEPAPAPAPAPEAEAGTETEPETKPAREAEQKPEAEKETGPGAEEPQDEGSPSDGGEQGTEVTPSDGVTEKKDDKAAAFDYSSLSREDLIERLRNLLQNQSVQAIIEDVDHIKLNFYKKLKQETEQKRKKFVEEGGNIEDFRMPDDPLEQQVKDLFKTFRERKAEYNRTLEEQKTKNLELKYAVIEKIKDLVNRKESIGKTFQEFRELQKEWRAIGLVPQASLKDMWDTYHHHVEKFYDYIKINKELRDLDLKKNLEAKIRLCEKAEELILAPSVLEAFRTLQKYHDQFREIGPVPSEVRSEIWERFKAATYKINTRHQEHFEDLKKEQKKNLEEKNRLCEKAEEISHLVLKSHKEWDKRSKELLEIQKTWRTIGFAPKKDNNKIYKRFREACDAFFDGKREFYARNKELQQNNLQQKIELCVQAEALQDSTDWKETTNELIGLQKQWKEIGPVPRRQSDRIWKRFRKACDHFFQQKSNHFRNIGQSYEENLRLKETLIREIEAFKPAGKAEENLAKLNEFQRKWTEIGFVPIKEKDALQNRYREAIDKSLDSLKIDEKQKNIMKFRSKLSNLAQKPNSNNKLNHERDKYAARLQQLKSDIVLWENNIGFFAKTKNAESMIREVENKINDAKETIRMLETKIDMIDNSDAMNE